MLKGFSLLPRLPSIAPHARRMYKSDMSGSPKPSCSKFISLGDGEDAMRNSYQGFKLRLVSYNILAQVYVRSTYFPHSPSSCLKWKARSQAILTALRELNADFFCIQELDEYDSFYKSKVKTFGYSSIYVQRSGNKHDGCGIFYKQDCAELVSTEEIYYNDLISSSISGTRMDTSIEGVPQEDSHGDRGDPEDPLVRLKRDCVGLLAAFKLNDPSHHVIIVANTHIYWDPEWADVKLAQAKYLLQRLARFEEVVSQKHCCSPSVIVAGDFNSTPGDEVYQSLISANTMRLFSLYAANGGEPPFTNCTPDFTGTLDYIFLAETSHLKPVSLLQVPGTESAEVAGGLPNHYHPSDHLPIGGDFEILGTSKINSPAKSAQT